MLREYRVIFSLTISGLTSPAHASSRSTFFLKQLLDLSRSPGVERVTTSSFLASRHSANSGTFPLPKFRPVGPELGGVVPGYHMYLKFVHAEKKSK